jgi:multiple sugar transport system permease protein
MSAEVGRRRLDAWLVNGALLVLAVLSLAPLVWMLSVSFMAEGAASRFPPPLLPAAPTLDNYRALFARTGMARHFANSLLVAGAITAGSLAINTLAGYAFAKLRFTGRERVFRMLLAALVVPAQVAMLPLFLLLKELGLVDTLSGVVLPSLASVFGIFLVRQYARGIPDALLEAARLDGAGELRVFATVVLPMLRPVLVTLAIFTFMAAWNDFMWPLIVLSDESRYTLPVALASLSREHVMDVEMMMAGAVVTVLPVLLLFLLLQRWYIQGLLMGSVKE